LYLLLSLQFVFFFVHNVLFLAELLKLGWRPSRTIILASWDGEEYGLLGSTNYAESNQELFRYANRLSNVCVMLTIHRS